MESKEKIYTGLMYFGDKDIAFIGSKFLFSFLSNKPEESIMVVPCNDFLFGKTYNSQKIALFCDDVFNFKKSATLRTPLFVVSDTNTADVDITEFNSIEFYGGTLKKVFPMDALRELREEGPFESGKVIYKYSNDSISFKFCLNDKEYKVTIYSIVGQSSGVEGSKLSNDKVCLRIELPEKVKLNEIDFHFNKIKDIISFLTYRQNAGFDDIIIRNDVHPYNSSHVYIQSDYEFTEKFFNYNIHFSDIKEELPKLFELFYSDTDEEPTYDLGFLPENDKAAKYVDVHRIRSIASTVEFLYDFLNIKTEKNPNLEGLKKQVKECVKQYRDSHSEISKKTYDLIFGSIGHWSLSLADRINLMVDEFVEPLGSFADKKLIIDRDSIVRFVDYRNTITHRGPRIINHDIANTSFDLIALIYCCYLRRIGLDNDRIDKLINGNTLFEQI